MLIIDINSGYRYGNNIFSVIAKIINPHYYIDSFIIL